MNNFLNFSKRFIPEPPEKYGDVRVKNLSDVKEADETLLDYIFGLDPNTKLPSGDLSVYLGDKANPEIKAFIQSQLLKDLSENGSHLPTDVTNQFKNISDDDIANFSRNHGESREEYGDRLRLYFLQERKARLDRQHQAEMEKLLHPKHDE